ncbi:hypothetical protein [Bdellovibrio sp. KM01]|uniref:hypothetical protein n=1 Tax=Bdellovibrio sp. KM01 TaxID=2748865 RepID=UPI0015EA63F2|nr:hypothetical protein [Bdellovibrio sp. KM01]QLY23791.1 hypothetical protein HW988_09790 [Bdellovibrio sp. KM01]
MKTLVSLLIMTFLSLSVSAKEQERATLQIDEKVVVEDVLVKKGQPKKEQLTVSGYTIQSSSLDAVAKKYKTKIKEFGEGEDLVLLVCLIGSDKTALEFSSGDMGGESNQILTIGLYQKSSKYKHKKDCETVDKRFKKTKIAGLTLGMSEKEVVKKLGEPSKQAKAFILYYFEDKKKINGVKFDVTSVIHVKLEKGKVISVSVSQFMVY